MEKHKIYRNLKKNIKIRSDICNIAVVGAGVTGLAAAARLAAKGHQVTIFEKNEQVGGRMSQFKKDGFTFDMGPTIVMVPDVYKAVFEESGKRFEDYVDMVLTYTYF